MEPVIRSITVIPPGTEFREQVAAEMVGQNWYRLLENPVFSDHINFGTIVTVKDSSNGELIVDTVIAESNFTTHRFLLPKELVDRKSINDLAKPILDAGGTWEKAMGGIFFIHLPKGSPFNPNSIFEYTSASGV